MPFELKEVAFKHGTIYGLVLVWDQLKWLSDFTGYAQLFVLGSAAYSSLNYLVNAVDRVDLHKDGKQVTFHFKVAGQTATVPIKDVAKGTNERDLVQTFEEGFFFPVKVGGKTYYLHGRGHESIKHGEAFRAILNGKNLEL